MYEVKQGDWSRCHNHCRVYPTDAECCCCEASQLIQGEEVTGCLTNVLQRSMRGAASAAPRGRAYFGAGAPMSFFSVFF